DNSATKTNLVADSTASPTNFLAAWGTLRITKKDAAYLFDAVKDSIAFINVHDDNDDAKRYFGITAINKDHNMSFGISSTGYAHADKNSDIAGGQFLLGPGYKTEGFQYSLSKYAGQKDFVSIH